MAFDLETILTPVSDDNPVGEDMAYDNGRQLIEQAFETNDSGDGEGAEEKDWRAVIRLIEGQFSQTKDIWLAVYLARAGAKSGSLDTVELGVQALAGLLETYWDTVHPQLEELGLPGRKAPCDSLAARGEFLIPLERTVLIAHPRLGAFTGADIERFRDEQTSADGYGMFRAALDELGDDALQQALAKVESIDEALHRADRIFTDAAAGDVSPNYAPTYAALATIKRAVSSFLGGADGDAADAGADDADADAGAGGGSGGGGGARLTGKVQSRDDVIRALDAISDYYQRAEPSHPLRQFSQRARHWVNMDFMELMKEIVPDATRQASELLNKREDDY